MTRPDWEQRDMKKMPSAIASFIFSFTEISTAVIAGAGILHDIDAGLPMNALDYTVGTIGSIALIRGIANGIKYNSLARDTQEKFYRFSDTAKRRTPGLAHILLPMNLKPFRVV